VSTGFRDLFIGLYVDQPLQLPIKNWSFSLPNMETCEIFAKYGVGNLFYMLPRQKIYKLLVALLLEKKIIFLSKTRNILSSVVYVSS
jgi:hypothetical protein